jgi:hypothetical protein
VDEPSGLRTNRRTQPRGIPGGIEIRIEDLPDEQRFGYRGFGLPNLRNLKCRPARTEVFGDRAQPIRVGRAQFISCSD